MKRVLSVLVASLLVPGVLQSQERPNQFSRAPASSDSAYASFAPRVRSWTERDSIAANGSHAVRNGAITGVLIGVAAGLYGGSRAAETVGCKTSIPVAGVPSCHEQGTQNELLVAGVVVGGVLFGLIGAASGRLWQLLQQ